ncbi:GNAT family N-acetyltransferase [Leucobacter tardus]|nr:GNAT family N-acetyltransferase [Leucobacter tardus]
MTRHTIRAARPDDVAEILDMIHELAVYEREPDAVKTTVDQLRDTLFAPSPAVFAHVAEAEAGGEHQLAGFAIWFLTYSTWEGVHGIHLEDLYVRPTTRGSGLGRRLMGSLAGECDARGYARLEWKVLKWNELALGLYRSVGGQAQDEWEVYRLDGAALRALAHTVPAP